MKKKQPVYKGLDKKPVFYTDTSFNSPDFFQITEFPNRLTSGKNLIKLRGNPTNLQVGSDINIEVLDYNNNPIYSELVEYIDEDKARVISIYVYSDTSPGDATIYLTGTARSFNNQPIPNNWKNKENIKWQRSLAVNPNEPNKSEIIYETTPSITISEQIGVQLDRLYTTNQFINFTGSNATLNYISNNNSPRIFISGAKFDPEMENGSFTASFANQNLLLPLSPFTPDNLEFKSKIKKVFSDSIIELENEFTVSKSSSLSLHTYKSFITSNFEINYEASPTYIPTENSESYALLEIEDLEPATGDVSNIKVYMSGTGRIGSYELINDIELEETELLVASTSSIEPYKSIGLIQTQSIIDTYWLGSTYVNGNIAAGAGSGPTLLRNTGSLNNSIEVVSSQDLTSLNTVHVIETTNTQAIFKKDSEYKITFNAKAEVSSSIGDLDPEILIFMSGSSFNYNSTNYYNSELRGKKPGKQVGRIKVSDSVSRIDDNEFIFNADKNGFGDVVFVIVSGKWFISDISVTTNNNSGYTPNYTRIRTEIPTKHKSKNELAFRLEYYNIDGVKSKFISNINNLTFQGGNRYIDGDYSMLTGSLYIADNLNTGVAISGLKNTGFIRSLGYNGFDAGDPGFLIWSGSALPGQTSKGNPYNGVGLELYANDDNYFRYATQPSELDIRTERFFVGDTDSAFISGSDGNIEISSSGFHLNATGDVTASSFVAVQGSDILFDSNNEFIDGLNVGRIVYFNRDEYTYTGNLQTSPQTSSIFETFLLPGETNIQASFTVQFTRASSTSVSLRGSWYIQSASNTSATPTGNDYDSWSTPTQIASNQPLLVYFGGASTRGTSVNINLSDSDIANYQGTYCRIYMIVSQTTISHPGDQVRMKSFVYRTSRSVGSSIAPPLGGPVK